MLPLVLGVALAATSPVLHLHVLLQEAREKNPDILAAKAQARAATAAIKPAAALDDPMLMLQLWNAPADFSSVPVMLQASQNLPLGGKLAARRSAAVAESDAATAGVAVHARDLEAGITRAYFDLFLAGETIRIDTSLEDTLRETERAAGSRVSAGQGEQIEVLKAQEELLELEAEVETAGAQRTAANARLAALIDEDPSRILGSPTTPQPLAILPMEQSLRARALQSRPELAAADAVVAGAEAQVTLARAARVPDLGVSAAAMYTFGGTDREHVFLFAGVQGNLPVFGDSKLQPRVDAATAQVESARDLRRSMQNKVFAELAEAYADVEAEGRQIRLHHDLVPVAHRILQSALAGYSAGRTPFLMVLDSERELQLHELDLARHLAAYEQRLADLEHAVGADLGLLSAAEAGGSDAHSGGSQP